MLRASLGLLFVAATASQALAQANDRVRPRLEAVPMAGDKVEGIIAGHTIFLNRCQGGCAIVPGVDDATSVPIASAIANSALTLPEYDQFQPGEWEGTVQCVKEVYSPYGVTITDQRPTSGPYAQIVVGGTRTMPGGTLIGGNAVGSGGIAGLPGCGSIIQKGVSYAFTDMLDVFANEAGGSRIHGLCWIIAQETAHNLGLEHEFEFIEDKRSACNDPMTYRDECGGQKFFRNRFASCGEFPGDGRSPRACSCGATQNSHLKLTSIFGPKTSIVPAPTANIVQPTSSSNANSLGATVVASAGSARGVEKVELYLNGYKWAQVTGVQFGRQGQPNPSNYSIPVPAEIPDSIYDVEIRAYDDLDIVGTSTKVTVTKGAAGGCTAATECLKGQECEAGKCFWAPPVGEIGDKCDYPQYCKSGLCQGTAELQVCTQNCVVGGADSCPAGLECLAAGASGICFPTDTGGTCGGCSSSGETPWAPFGLAGFVLGLIAFRRRR